MDAAACNFNPAATFNNGSCGQNDCEGQCNGTAVVDCTDECNGTAKLDCAGECNGTAELDCAGQCNGTAKLDCAGQCNGTAELDCADECNGTAVVDCAGECGGSAVVDACGICNGSEADANNCLGIDDVIAAVKQFQIQRLYPNPFNPVLHINFDIAWSGVIQVEIMDISGSHIEILHSSFLQSGSHELSWNAESMPSGMYLVSLKSGDESLIEKVVLLK